MKRKKEQENSIFATLKYDIPASIAVFLVSVPLSLGIALASGAPLFAGLLTGIIGGVVVAPLGASGLGVSGTTAGLAVIALAYIEQFGFAGFLLAVVIAGLIQIILGIAKAGVIKYYFPSAVINGMLTGIGIIIMLKQIPHALGYDADYEGDITFVQQDHYSSLTELGHMLSVSSMGAMIIALASLLALLAWEWLLKSSHRYVQLFQGPLIAIGTGIFISRLLPPEYALKGEHMVNLPPLNNAADLLNQLHFPDFNQLSNPAIYLAAGTLALLASLETLLSEEAIDKLDPDKHISSSNRELMAQGVGNICCGLLGGLPLTQVIVRSSINIQSGARTKVSAFTQGLLILLTLLIIPEALNAIPLASIAVVLLVAGYRLMQPAICITMYQAGWYHFLPFCATVLGLVFSDMLLGIGIGLTIALFAILLENYKSAFYCHEFHIGNKTIIRFAEHVSFLNKANIQRIFKQLPRKAEVVIDATRAKYIDYDVYEIIQNFKQDAKRKKIKLTIENLRGFGALPPIANVRAHDYYSQKSLTPAKALNILQEGNQRFVNNLESNRNLLEQINDTSDNQFPLAIILSCIDSRTSVELIFDLGLGDVFSARVAGNVINDDILGSMEYACKVAGAKLIVVLGHSHCGAVKGACSGVEMDHLTGLLAKIKPALTLVREEHESGPKLDKEELIQKVAVKNVKLAVEQITQQSPILANMLEEEEIDILGAMYNIETGRVRFYSKD